MNVEELTRITSDILRTHFSNMSTEDAPEVWRRAFIRTVYRDAMSGFTDAVRVPMPKDN
jgi:hypothetical protein